MSAKKVGACLCVSGLGCFAGAVHMDGKSSFDNGAFIGQIALAMLGVVMLFGGLTIAIFGE